MSACTAALRRAPSPPSAHRGVGTRPRACAVRAASSSSATSPAAVLGEGWSASQVAIFADSPTTRALVTCDLLELRPPELCPELPMWLLRDGDDILELWARTEKLAAEACKNAGDKKEEHNTEGVNNGSTALSNTKSSLHPPYWAVPWVGGQGVARFILDNPEVVAGKTVLDVGSGCGVAALAAAMAGAKSVCANDIDPLAGVAFLENARACGLNVTGVEGSSSTSSSTLSCILDTSVEDLLQSSATSVAKYDVIMAGDVCFVKNLAEAFQGWLGDVSTRKPGAVTILGDPRRQDAWAPKPGWATGMESVATYEVTTKSTSPLTEGQAVRNTAVWLSEEGSM